MKACHAAFLALVALCSPASAYVLEGIVWGLPNPTIYTNLNASQGKLGGLLPAFPLEDGSSSFDQVFDAAVADWNQYLLRLQIGTIEGTNPNGFELNDGINEAGFGASAGGDSIGGETLAVTEIYYYTGSPQTFAEADIVFSSGDAWNSYRGPLAESPIDLRRVALHELGHFIGLDHPDQAGQTVNAIMNSLISNTDDLTADDIAGGQYLYGARVAAVSQVFPAADFNGDGKSDLLWRNYQTNQIGVWLMNGTAIDQIANIGSAPSDWQIVGLADLNRDGKTDIIFHNTSSGQFGVWFMNGPTVTSMQNFNLPANYPVLAFADFDRDGNPDVVQYDPSSGTAVISQNLGNLTFVEKSAVRISTDCVLAGVADITGDGIPEVIWRNRTSGLVGAWFVSNFQVANEVSLAAPPLNWRLRGIGHFSGKASDDLLWENTQTGQVGLWTFTGGVSFSTPVLNAAAPPGWQPFGGLNLDGSSVSDIFWLNTQDYSVGAWFLSGTNVNEQLIGLNPGPNWRPQPDPGN